MGRACSDHLVHLLLWAGTPPSSAGCPKLRDVLIPRSTKTQLTVCWEAMDKGHLPHRQLGTKGRSRSWQEQAHIPMQHPQLPPSLPALPTHSVNTHSTGQRAWKERNVMCTARLCLTCEEAAWHTVCKELGTPRKLFSKACMFEDKNKKCIFLTLR